MNNLTGILLTFFIFFIFFIIIKFFSFTDKISKERRFQIYREMRIYFYSHSNPYCGEMITFNKAFNSIKKKDENIMDLKELWETDQFIKDDIFHTENELKIKILNKIIENE